jgi:hypothetical protein
VADYGGNVIEQLLDAERIAKDQVVTLRLDKKGEVKLTARPAS